MKGDVRMGFVRRLIRLLAKLCIAAWAVWIMAMLTVKAIIMDPITGGDVEWFILSGLFVLCMNLLDIAIEELHKLLKKDCPAVNNRQDNLS